MQWNTPTFVEINMSAEIGGYYDDDSERDPCPPRAPATSPHTDGELAAATGRGQQGLGC